MARSSSTRRRCGGELHRTGRERFLRASPFLRWKCRPARSLGASLAARPPARSAPHGQQEYLVSLSQESTCMKTTREMRPDAPRIFQIVSIARRCRTSFSGRRPPARRPAWRRATRRPSAWTHNESSPAPPHSSSSSSICWCTSFTSATGSRAPAISQQSRLHTARTGNV